MKIYSNKVISNILKVAQIQLYNIDKPKIIKLKDTNLKNDFNLQNKFNAKLIKNFSEQDKALYKTLYNKGPKQTDYNWIVDNNKSINWNYTGNYYLYKNEFNARDEAYNKLIELGFNNPTKNNEFKEEIYRIFDNLMNLLYPKLTLKERKIILSKIKFKTIFNLTLDDYLDEALSPSKNTLFNFTLSSSILYRMYREITNDYMGVADLNIKDKIVDKKEPNEKIIKRLKKEVLLHDC